ncbi:gamma-type small acid-soluble spore protein, partial [Shimazuella kribbensis]|uniref:gamma-type small acid-soluble spore protein n=1 Tax=Shimazuella kribbensis TaxID=139808 RepID=UPI00048F6695
MNNKYKTDPAHVRKQNAQSQKAGAAGGYQTEFASESATNAQQVRAQNARSAGAASNASAAGGYQTEFASESATNA